MATAFENSTENLATSDTCQHTSGSVRITSRSVMMRRALRGLTPNIVCMSMFTQSSFAYSNGGSWKRKKIAMLSRLSHPERMRNWRALRLPTPWLPSHFSSAVVLLYVRSVSLAAVGTTPIASLCSACRYDISSKNLSPTVARHLSQSVCA